MALSLWVSHKLANKTNLIKSIPLSLSLSLLSNLLPPHPLHIPSTQTRSESAYYI